LRPGYHPGPKRPNTGLKHFMYEQPTIFGVIRQPRHGERPWTGSVTSRKWTCARGRDQSQANRAVFRGGGHLCFKLLTRNSVSGPTRIRRCQN